MSAECGVQSAESGMRSLAYPVSPEIATLLVSEGKDQYANLKRMKLAMEDGLLPENRLLDLHAEANEILSIVIQSIRTAKRKKS